ncbi:hypothetical protein B0H15DRAFT_804135 [Mycena belliarum]|uniref:Uncharacterized protein n=1 Tax=Mycena belliarum TaxID=1033014 RepID=A0AAD6TZX1_9AGAR|nr:hypothetical protein B0H15DRAFT_804135 [Mycena belliae]
MQWLPRGFLGPLTSTPASIPRLPNSDSDLFLMRFLKDTFLAKMQEFGLVVSQTSSISLLLTDHISNIANELRARGLDIAASNMSVLSHEDQPLAHLYVVNRGVPRPSDNQIRLRQLPLRPNSTLGEIGANRVQFALPGLCIETFEGQNHLCLYFGQTARTHHCLSQRIYTMFPRDRVREEWTLADGDSSCGESDHDLGLDDDDDDDFENLPLTPTPASVPNTRILRSTQVVSNLREVPPTITVSDTPSLPATMWEEPWQPHLRVVHDSFREDSVYLEATNGIPSQSVLYKGESVEEAADDLIKTIGRCVDEGDFTGVLFEDQGAVIYRPGTRTILSSGDGVLREVFHAAHKKLLETTGPQWLTPRLDEKLSMLFIRSQGLGQQQNVFGPRQRAIATATAFWSLRLIKGLAVDPVDPGLIQFLLNDCDLRSITPRFMAEYHPGFKTVLDAWRLAGPMGNVNEPGIVNQLATFHDLEIRAVAGRDQQTHDGLFVEMIYRTQVGSEPPSHIDVVAAARGARLACRNGWTFTKHLRSVAGGSDALIRRTMASVMGPHSILARITVVADPALLGPITAAMGGESIMDILSDYLMGSGIPCPTLFESAKQHFPPGLDYSLVDSPVYRAQSFAWAISGSPYLPTNLGNIRIILVGDNDPLYLGTRSPTLLPAMLSGGTFSLRTCFLECRIPASFLLAAAQASYTENEPRCRRDFIHHWLLCQSLNAIENHTFA